MCIYMYIMNDHYIQKQLYNGYMNELENSINIKYNHSFENGSLSERHWALQNPTRGAGTKSMYSVDFLQEGSQKNDCHAMSSAFLSPIGGHPIDPEEADEELHADQVHKEWNQGIL